MTEHNDDVIKRLDCMDRKITTLTSEFHNYREEWNPMLETLNDVAAVGRVGRVMGKVIIWGGAVSAAIMAMYLSAKGGFK